MQKGVFCSATVGWHIRLVGFDEFKACLFLLLSIRETVSVTAPERFEGAVYLLEMEEAGRTDDKAEDNVMEAVLVVLGEQTASALIGGTGDCRLAFTALGDRNIKVWIWHFSKPPS